MNIFPKMQQTTLILSPSRLSYNHTVDCPESKRVSIEEVHNSVTNPEVCWICYDNEKRDAFIKPCQCKGDMSAVHKECLQRWLMQKILENRALNCKLCGHEYVLSYRHNKWKWYNELSRYQWITILFIVTCMCLTMATCWSVVHFYNNFYIQIFCATITLLVIYISFRFLGKTILYICRSAKIASLDISDHSGTRKNIKDPTPA